MATLTPRSASPRSTARAARSRCIAVDAVDMAIEDGEIVALLGSSGCGKTSTLRMIAGFEDVTQRRDPPRRPGDPHAARRRSATSRWRSRAIRSIRRSRVRDNIAFALLRDRHPQRRGRGARSSEIAELLEIERHPRSLSADHLRRPAAARQPRPARWSATPTSICSTSRWGSSSRSCAPSCAAASRTLIEPQDDDGVRHPRPDRGERARRPHRGDGEGRAAAVRARRPSSRSGRPTCSSPRSSASRR